MYFRKWVIWLLLIIFTCQLTMNVTLFMAAIAADDSLKMHRQVLEATEDREAMWRSAAETLAERATFWQQKYEVLRKLVADRQGDKTA